MPTLRLEEVMQKAKWNVFILTLALGFSGAQAAAAPRPAGQNPQEKIFKKAEPQSANVYRVKYTVSEVENGKTINARSYVMMVKPGTMARTTITSRVPYLIEANKQRGELASPSYQFQDVGTTIFCQVTEQEDRLLVRTRLNMSSVSGEKALPPGGSPPVFGELSLEDDTLAEVGKTAFVGSVDETTSNRRYVVEVTVTKAM
jgi:chorismate synthase